MSRPFAFCPPIDRLGRENFVRQYLLELDVLGYERSSSLELEALARQDEPLRPQPKGRP